MRVTARCLYYRPQTRAPVALGAEISDSTNYTALGNLAALIGLHAVVRYAFSPVGTHRPEWPQFKPLSWSETEYSVLLGL